MPSIRLRRHCPHVTHAVGPIEVQHDEKLAPARASSSDSAVKRKSMRFLGSFHHCAR